MLSINTMNQQITNGLKKKQLSACALSVYDQLIVGAERINLNKKHTNQLFMRKCIHTINFLIMKNIAISENYGDMINFVATKLEEPIAKQYLETCQKNASYTSYTAAESVIDAMNFYFESSSLEDIQEAEFVALYADESENTSHKESFSMFVTYYSKHFQEIKTSFLGIVNLKGKTSFEIMDFILKFLQAKSLNIGRVFFSMLDSTNSMRGNKNGLQRRLRNYLPFNIYINCRNHCLALCLPHLMKDQYLGELVSDLDALLLGLWKTFHYSPKKSSILESIQSIYGKKHLRILKAAIARWLTHGQASKRVIDYYQELLETMDMICIDTNNADICGYRNKLMSQTIILHLFNCRYLSDFEHFIFSSTETRCFTC